MKLKNKILGNLTFYKGFSIMFILLAIIIVAGVIFIYPQVGVADQGDFDRVMAPAGLTLLDIDKSNPNFIRFYDYIVTDYHIDRNIVTFFLTLINSSIGYLIFIICTICQIFGSDVFRTQYLAFIYAGMYIFALWKIISGLNIKSKFKNIFLAIIILFVFLDGNYLRWFNSLYGEPMMISTLLLFIAVYLSYINNKYVKKIDNHIGRSILYILIAAFLYLGSKMQVMTTMPFVVILIIKALWDNRKILKKKVLIGLSILFCIVISYPLVIGMQGGELSKDTQYNSVFYGILNGSETPEQDLIDMGLNPDMAVEAGKHAYESKEDYVKYIPRTEITEQEFYSKMSNMKLAMFYLTHPLRLIDGLEYTASKAYITSTSLGAHSREYSEEPVKEFHRFTLWSDFRENNFIGHFWFIALIFAIVLCGSIYKFIKSKGNLEIRNKIMLLWGVMFMGAIQFPMPFVGNGRADTAKQLFLFNFIFDILIVVIVVTLISKIYDLFTNRKVERSENTEV